MPTADEYARYAFRQIAAELDQGKVNFLMFSFRLTVRELFNWMNGSPPENHPSCVLTEPPSAATACEFIMGEADAAAEIALGERKEIKKDIFAILASAAAASLRWHKAAYFTATRLPDGQIKEYWEPEQFVKIPRDFKEIAKTMISFLFTQFGLDVSGEKIPDTKILDRDVRFDIYVGPVHPRLKIPKLTIFIGTPAPTPLH